MAHHNRFFVSPDAIKNGVVTLSGATVHQIKKVLRLAPGDHVTLLDNSNWRYDVVIDRIEADQLSASVVSKVLVTNEPRTKLTVYQGLLRGPQFENVLQKATEVGASVIVPTVCQRCIVSLLGEASDHKVSRWERIVTEAAEQSGRGKIPVLRPAMLLEQACEQVRGLSLLPWEDEHSLSLREALRRDANALALRNTHSFKGSEEAPSTGNGGHTPSARDVGTQRPFSVNIFIGPEGGFTPQEISIARGYGIIPVTLGPRILRAETAALVATTLVLHELGDMERERS